MRQLFGLVLILSVLISTIFLGGYAMYQINTVDIKSQVKAIVDYNQGIRK
jgi:hypothetical protein